MEIIDCSVSGIVDKSYSESVRKFSLSLHFHSPRGYEFVRSRFNNHLPHSSTLRKWYMLSDSNGKPGVCKDSIQMLKSLVEDMNAKGQKLICSLCFDEMHIKKHLMWSHNEKKFIGNITYGIRNDGTNLPIAKQALVFMLNGVNIDFNLPVAFYFIRELNANEKSSLLAEILKTITDLNIKVISVAFDGLPMNITTCTRLGASFLRKKFEPYFYSHSGNDKIRVVLDAPHMVKLARNCLGRKKILYDGNNSKIE